MKRQTRLASRWKEPNAEDNPIPESTISNLCSPPEPSGAHPLVYSVTQAADLLGISRAFAYELVARGELPFVRLGRRRLVPRIALLALVNG